MLQAVAANGACYCDRDPLMPKAAACGLAPEALLIIRKLYAIEKLARDAEMSAEQRHMLRAENVNRRGTLTPVLPQLRMLPRCRGRGGC